MEIVTKFTTKELRKLVAQARTNILDSSITENKDIIKLPEIPLNNESFSHYIERHNVLVTRNFQPLSKEEKQEWREIAKPYLKELKNKVKENGNYFTHKIVKPPTNEEILAAKIVQKNQRKDRKEKFSNSSNNSNSNTDSNSALLTDGFYWDYNSLNKEIERDKESNFIRLIVSHGLKKPVMFRISKDEEAYDEELGRIKYFTVKNIINHILNMYHNELGDITSPEFIKNHKIDSLLKCEKNNTWVIDLKKESTGL